MRSIIKAPTFRIEERVLMKVVKIIYSCFSLLKSLNIRPILNVRKTWVVVLNDMSSEMSFDSWMSRNDSEADIIKKSNLFQVSLKYRSWKANNLIVASHIKTPVNT